MVRLVQKFSKNKLKEVNLKKLDKYLKPISLREKKFLKERKQLDAIFMIYLQMILRITNGLMLINGGLNDFFYPDNRDNSNISKLLTGLVSGINMKMSYEELKQNLTAGNNIKKLHKGKYVLRDKEYIERSLYYLFIEQLSSIINIGRSFDFLNEYRKKSVFLSNKYGLSFWIVFVIMLGLSQIWFSIESVNQEINNFFIENTDVLLEPFQVI